ncbi:sensor histidine kinase [Roseomonas sp. CCTCC AB2023176]|uniref:sensor histidine kinase n=1 Tax=Roseomonas sp. CCTCC AB2023176 TaxID=3342640 RepID=UPI0035E0551B
MRTNDAASNPAPAVPIPATEDALRRECDTLREEAAALRRELERVGEDRAALQHRIRNSLGAIRSIARRTAVTSTDLDDYAAHLDGRIGAFARVQAAVIREPTAGLDLAQLVADELLSCSAREGEGVLIEGPEIRLRSKPAETLALTVHELATNAVKYGALACPGGQLTVTWRAEDPGGGHPWLILDWIEAGVPDPKPSRRGFGTDLLEKTLPYDLKAEVSLVFGTNGVRCTIALPMTAQTVAA